jgi:hypothetical protein
MPFTKPQLRQTQLRLLIAQVIQPKTGEVCEHGMGLLSFKPDNTAGSLDLANLRQQTYRYLGLRQVAECGRGKPAHVRGLDTRELGLCDFFDGTDFSPWRFSSKRRVARL